MAIVNEDTTTRIYSEINNLSKKTGGTFESAAKAYEAAVIFEGLHSIREELIKLSDNVTDVANKCHEIAEEVVI